VKIYLNSLLILFRKTMLRLFKKGKQMKKKLKISYIGVGLIGVLTYTLANIPYLFEPNTPIKATEVNKIFESIDNQITLLEQESSTSQYTTSVGEEVTIGSHTYKMITIPFEEFGTKEHYLLKYPYNKNITNRGVTFKCIPKNSKPYSNKLKEFSTFISTPSYRRYMRIGIGINEEHQWLEDDASSTIYIKVNQTKVRLNLYLSQNKNRDKILIDNPTELDHINWKKMKSRSELLEEIQTYFKYIDIIKVEE